MTTKTTILATIDPRTGHEYRVDEVFNPEWETPKPLYFVERNQGAHASRFFNVYVGEDRQRAIALATF